MMPVTRLSTSCASPKLSFPGRGRLPVCRSGLSEDVLARLKAAEDEAAMLRKELAAAKVLLYLPFALTME